MRRRATRIALTAAAVAIAIYAAAGAGAQSTLSLNSARITISGTSNIRDYTASTSAVRVTRGQFGDATGPDIWSMPGGIAALDVAIPAVMLTSARVGVDKNMHKALKTTEFADITFSLTRLVMRGDTNGKATGMLTVAGVEREVVLDVETRRDGAQLAVHGVAELLMTDYGITPPKAMLGMLETNPKVRVTFDALVAVPQA